MKKYINIIFSLMLSFILVLTTSCGKKSAKKETGFIIDTSETKLVYKIGEELDLSGLKVKAAYGIGEYKDLSSDEYNLDTEACNMHIVGSYEVIVTYKNHNPKSFFIDVQKLNQDPLTSMPQSWVTETSILMTNMSSVEYRIDNEPYQGKIEFTGLQKGSTHTIYARLKETSEFLASAEISKEITLLSGPAEANLIISSTIIGTEDWEEFNIQINANDDAGTNVYTKVVTPDIPNADIEFYNGTGWIDLDADNILNPTGAPLKSETLKFRIRHFVETSTQLYVEIRDVSNDKIVASTSTQTSIVFILGPATTTLIQSADYAIVDEAYNFQIEIKLNNDTHLIDEFPVYGQIIYHSSQIPNDGFIVEFYDKEKEEWITASRTTMFQFNKEGMYLNDGIYDFRFTPLGQTYKDFTFYVDFRLLLNDQTEISTQFTIDVIELSEAKTKTLAELQTLINLDDYEGTTKAEVESKYNDAVASINAATSGKELKEALETFKEYINALGD